jgi:hypothetical protein
MPEKQKRRLKREPRHISNVSFVLLWALSCGLTWCLVHGTGLYLEQTIPYFWDYQPTMVNLYALGSFAFLPVAVAWSQQWLFNHYRDGALQNWGLMTWGLWIISAVVLLIVAAQPLYRLSIVGELLVLAGSFFLPIALGQTLFLRVYVQHAWLWIGAAIVGTVIVAMSLPGFLLDYESTEQAFVIVTTGMFLRGLVMGVAMVWLLQHRKADISQHSDQDTHPGEVVPRA